MVFLCDKNNKRWDSSEIEWATARVLVKMENFILPILYKTSCGSGWHYNTDRENAKKLWQTLNHID